MPSRLLDELEGARKDAARPYRFVEVSEIPSSQLAERHAREVDAQTGVEVLDREAEMPTVGVTVYGSKVQLGQHEIDARDGSVEVVDQGAVPVEDQMALGHAVDSHETRTPRPRMAALASVR